VPVPCFLLFLCFRKVTQEIFSKLDETKAEPPIFTEASRRPKMRRRGPGAKLTIGWRGPAPGRATIWWGQVAHPLTLPFYLLNPLDGKNQKDGSLFLETYCKPPPSSKRDREDPGALCGTLSERGIPNGGLLHHHGHLRSDVWVVYLGLWVHSSS
jgi:hypothetical protein